jgi:hypothetical protein
MPKFPYVTKPCFRFERLKRHLGITIFGKRGLNGVNS